MSEEPLHSARTKGGINPPTPTRRGEPGPEPMEQPPVGQQPAPDVPCAHSVSGPPPPGEQPLQGGIPKAAPGEQRGGIMEGLKESMRKVGHAIDTGIGSIMKETGQNIRTTCPACSLVVLAPPSQYVQCPQCMMKFNAPSWATRTAEISKNIKGDLGEAWKSQHPPGSQPSATAPPERTTGA